MRLTFLPALPQIPHPLLISPLDLTSSCDSQISSPQGVNRITLGLATCQLVKSFDLCGSFLLNRTSFRVVVVQSAGTHRNPARFDGQPLEASECQDNQIDLRPNNTFSDNEASLNVVGFLESIQVTARMAGIWDPTGTAALSHSHNKYLSAPQSAKSPQRICPEKILFSPFTSNCEHDQVR